MLKLVDVLSVAADVARVDEDAVSEDAGVVRDLGVADHHDHHLQAVQELLHGMDLAGNLVALDPRVVALDGAGAEVLGHGLEHLQRRGLADVVDVLLVGEAVDADLRGVSDAALRHDLMGPVHDVLGHGGVGLKGEADEVGGLGVVADQEPRVDRDAVAADARTGVEDVHARVLVGDADDLATSMPPMRQILASSLEKAMFTARKVFSTTLVISAVRMSVTEISPWQKLA